MRASTSVENGLLMAGNRTLVELRRNERSELFVRKSLRPFADVAPERRALAREAYLQHVARGPSVVPILGVSNVSCEEGRAAPRAALECRSLDRAYVAGASLRELLVSHATGEPWIGAQQIEVLTRELLSALTRLTRLVADDSGTLCLVHGDLSPDNLLIEREGHVWLNDFGLAQQIPQPANDEAPDTFGSERYAAPEVISGERPGLPSDVYQCCLLLKLIYEPSLSRASRSLLHSASELPACLPGALAPLIARGLSPAPTERPSIAELMLAKSRV